MSWIRKWKKSKKKYSWRKIVNACDVISKQCEEYNPTVLVAISRGGLIPGTIIANNLNVRHVYSVGIASYSNIGNGNELGGNIKVYQKPDLIKLGSMDERILIVDDISDRGTTFMHVESMFREQCKYKHIRTASLVVKPSTVFVPSYFYKYESDDRWIVFPWER